MLGRLFHYSIDAVLVSTILAGVRRSTGLTVQPKKVTENESVGYWIDRYLWVGEAVMDQSVAMMSMSSMVERKR